MGRSATNEKVEKNERKGQNKARNIISLVSFFILFTIILEHIHSSGTNFQPLLNAAMHVLFYISTCRSLPLSLSLSSFVLPAHATLSEIIKLSLWGCSFFLSVRIESYKLSQMVVCQLGVPFFVKNLSLPLKNLHFFIN